MDKWFRKAVAPQLLMRIFFFIVVFECCVPSRNPFARQTQDETNRTRMESLARFSIASFGCAVRRCCGRHVRLSVLAQTFTFGNIAFSRRIATHQRRIRLLIAAHHLRSCVPSVAVMSTFLPHSQCFFVCATRTTMTICKHLILQMVKRPCSQIKYVFVIYVQTINRTKQNKTVCIWTTHSYSCV